MKTRSCLNPTCRRKFTPRPNVPDQQVCGAPDCRQWYKRHWSATSGPPRAIAAADWKKIEKAIASAPTWLRCIVLVARETGMRLSELLGLEIDDVIQKGKVRKAIAVRGQWKDGGLAAPKNGGSRKSYLPDGARKAIAEYASGRGWIDGSARLFPFSRAYVWRLWVRLQTTIGVSLEEGGHYRFHDLRHTAGTEMARGGRLDLAQKMLGHKSPATTARYVSQSDDEVLEDIEKTKRGRA